MCLFIGVLRRFNIWGHIAAVPACSSDALTNVLPHRNVMPYTSNPAKVYRHRADLLCHPMKATTIPIDVLGLTRPINPFTQSERSTL